MTSKCPDVLIVGGGIAGTSLAYYCAKEGLSVSLLEEGTLGCGTSGANQGNMSLHTRTLGIFLDLNMECLQIFRSLGDELDFDIGFREVSGVLVTDRQEDLVAIRERVTQLRAKGLNAEFLSSDGLRRFESKLSSHLIGGLFCRESARIYSPRLVVGFARAAKRYGAKIVTRTKVLQIRCENGKVREVQTESGVLGAGTVVIAAGTGSKALARMAGIDLPVELFQGELLVTEPTAEIGDHMINELEKADDKSYAKSNHLMHRYQIRLVFSREGEGNCLIGRSSEQLIEDRSQTTWAVVKGLAENVCRFLPSFSNTSIIRAFSGIRVISPDGFPIVGASGAIEGLYFSVAHGDKGVNTGPIIGKLLASYIATGEEPDLLKSFSPERFTRARGAAMEL